MKSGRLIEMGQRLTCDNSGESFVTDQTPDHRSILLLHSGLVILIVGATAGELDSPSLRKLQKGLVDKSPIVIGVDPSNWNWNLAKQCTETLDHERLLTDQERYAFRPSRADVCHDERMDQRVRHATATMSHEINLKETRLLFIPIPECANRDTLADLFDSLPSPIQVRLISDWSQRSINRCGACL